MRGVNLTRIESRPTGGGLGSYCFSIDAEGHIDDARVREALIGLHRVCEDVRFLGSYPRADGAQPLLRLGVSDAEFAEAQAWLDRVRRASRGASRAHLKRPVRSCADLSGHVPVAVATATGVRAAEEELRAPAPDAHVAHHHVRRGEPRRVPRARPRAEPRR